jgi:Protein of unknown function (DUF2971)
MRSTQMTTSACVSPVSLKLDSQPKLSIVELDGFSVYSHTDVPYMIVYKYLSPDRSNVLTNGRIRFTQPAVLNDPFETLPASTEYRNTLKNVMPELSQLQKESLNASGYSEEDVRNNVLSNVLDNVPELFSRYFGILSLSRCRDNILMWSHYADSHQGFVIGFDSENKFFTPSEGKAIDGLRDVKYSRKGSRPIFPPNGLDSLNPDEMREWNEHIFFTKSEDWAYEQEMRILALLLTADHKIPGKDGWDICLYSFDSQAVKEIIVGSRASIQTRKTLTRIWLTQYQEAEMFNSTISPTDFSVEIKPIDREKARLLIAEEEI